MSIGGGGSRHGVDKNVWLLQAIPSPEGERERALADIREEEVWFNQMLEFNHTGIIRSGLGKKIEQIESNHSHDFRPVDENTLFKVTKWLSSFGSFNEAPEGFKPFYVIKDNNRRGGTVHHIGSGRTINGEVEEVLPEIHFTEEDVILAAGLTSRLETARTEGRLPHLDDDLGGLTVTCPSYLTYLQAWGLEQPSHDN